MSMNKFPIIEIRGNPQDIGFKHGDILKDKIHSTVDWYKNIISKEEKEIIKKAKYFKSVIGTFNSSYIDEIEEIAIGAEIDPVWIYMLNGRSEIMNIFQNECTAVFFKSSAILGQNWDWAQELENLAVLLKIKLDNKPEILMMTEPGIIGKIGFNSNGVGACLNFLDSGKPTRGVPIHVILRSILESSSIDSALSTIGPVTYGKSANILIGSSTGQFVDIEFANDDIYYPKTEYPGFIHTNHYLENEGLNYDKEKLESSYSRYKISSNLLQKLPCRSINDMKKILLDRSDESLPICRHYVENPDIGTVGTICTVIMDLKQQLMHITRGSPLITPFSEIKL